MPSPAPRRRRAPRSSILVALIASSVVATTAVGSPASAASTCPRPDDQGNVAVIRGAETARLPGSTNADFCGATPDHAVTQVWNDGPQWNVKRLEVPRVGTWRIATSGRISFTPDPAFLQRPAGDSGPGHDAMLKYKVLDTDRHFRAGLATVYVLYPGSTSRPDVARTAPGRSVELRPLRNDVASWSGETRATLRHARFGGDSLRLGADGDEREVSTAQGTWRVSGRTVTFTPRAGLEGRTTPVRYVSTDSRGARSGSTMAIVVGDGSVPAGATGSESADRNESGVAVAATAGPASALRSAPDADATVSPRVWVPVAGLSLLAALALAVVQARRRDA